MERALARPLRLVLSVILIVGIPSIALGLIQLDRTLEQLRSSALAQEAAAAKSASEIVETRIESLRTSLATAVGDPAFREVIAARDDVRAIGMLNRMRDLVGPDVSALMLLDHSGEYRAGSPFQLELVGRHTSVARAAFVGSFLASAPYISGVDSTGPDRVPVVAVAALIRGPQGEPNAVVTAIMDLRRVASWVHPLLASFDDVYIVDARGLLVTRASAPGAGESRDLGADPVLAALRASRKTADSANDPLTGLPALVAAHRTTMGWSVIVTGSPSRLDEQLRPLAAGLIAGNIFLVVLLAAAALLVARATRRMLEAMKQQAVTDHLTGLYNRRFMAEQLELFDSLAKRYGRPYSVIAFDLDGLKRVNDQYGHEAGDAVLRDFARLLTGALRDSDIAVRLGGDEFIAILPETSMAEATKVFDRVRAALHAMTADASRAVTVSAGAVAWHAGRDAQQLVRVADEMLYRAKHEGRDRVVTEQVAAAGG